MTRQSLLWALQRNEGPPSWLFGTMHIKDDRAHQLCTQLYPMIQQSDHFIAEMDLDMQPEHVIPPSYNIHDFIKDKAYEKLRLQLKKSFNIPLDPLANLHPLMIMGLVSTSVLQSEHHISLDEHLWQFAKENDKPTSGLETYTQQLNILNSIEPELIYKQLIQIGRRPSLVRNKSTTGLDLYLSGNVHKLYQITKSSMQHLRKKVIYQRNIRMVSVIDHLDSDLSYFITVGAGHLSGKFGLISLLRKSGWSVKPVRMQVSLE